MEVDVSDQTSRQLGHVARSELGTLIPRLDFFYLRDLLITLVGREMKLRYKRSILGLAWTLLTPLTQLAVYFITFGVLLPLNVPNYPAFLFSGVLVWNWFQVSLYQGTSAIVDNRELIRRPGFPAAILPIVTVASYLVHFLLALPILFAFLIWGGVGMTSAIVALPLVIVIQFILTLSLAYFTATFYVTFRDTQHLLGVALNLLFFLTPIFYKSSDLPARYQALYRLNPMVHLVEAYRSIFLSGVPPDAADLLFLLLPALALLYVGYHVFKRASDHFVDEL
jgi:homopolymeric O-antigen transport system permease protein